MLRKKETIKQHKQWWGTNEYGKRTYDHSSKTNHKFKDLNKLKKASLVNDGQETDKKDTNGEILDQEKKSSEITTNVPGEKRQIDDYDDNQFKQNYDQKVQNAKITRNIPVEKAQIDHSITDEKVVNWNVTSSHLDQQTSKQKQQTQENPNQMSNQINQFRTQDKSEEQTITCKVDYCTQQYVNEVNQQSNPSQQYVNQVNNQINQRNNDIIYKEIKQNQHFDAEKVCVLDLCCAPGTKFCHLADRLIQSVKNFSLVGVDNSGARIAACDTVVAKYFPENKQYDIQLVHADGTSFFVDHPTQLCCNNICGSKKRRKISKAAKNKIARKNVSDDLAIKHTQENGGPNTASPQKSEAIDGCFDYVLVDAECSHDGSIKHIEKYQTQWGIETLSTRIPWIENQEQLCKLQMALLRNGFKNLKVGGVLVYSTCSFCRSQNEDIVEQFLEVEKGNAQKLELDFAAGTPCKFLDGEKSMARFDPVVSQTSGLFVAKLTKV
eukprot:TRINITY_DN22078_c0_g1_i3.p1 TRINITY_DN22078_c0_g1~~TRINITY_DN22078_c0_g1_i3.p1  ORF type:complete len:494 (-),score=70.80 TRINITY_DN22078_c0_g1_i3:196-1677(-)